MSGLFDTTSNYSFYAIPAAWVMAIAPHQYAILANKTNKPFDNRNPRSYVQEIENNQAVDKATKQLISRAEAAQMNGFENLGLFASAIVAGNLAGLSAQTMNFLSGGYLVSRALYNIIYINNDTQAAANTRSAVYVAGIGMIMTLFIKSGNALKSRAANLL